jgi:hypothetical protein
MAGLVEGRRVDTLPAAEEIEHALPGKGIWQRA